MVNDEPPSASSGVPAIDDFAERPAVESRFRRFFVVFGNGVLWAVVLWALAYLYGLYDVATGGAGIAPLLILAVTSVVLILLFWHHQRAAALLNFEFGAFAVWMGFFEGSVSLTNFVEGQWAFIFLWAWVISALLGGTVLAIDRQRNSHSATARTTRFFALTDLAVAAAFLACAFAFLLLFENRPIAAFYALKTFSLKDVAFSPDGETLATIGGCSGEQRVAKIWDAATGNLKAHFVAEQDEREPEYIAVQFTGDPPALAVAFSTSGFASTRTLTIRIWDISTGEVRQNFQWDDALYIHKPIFSRNGGSFVYANGDGHLRVFDLEAEQISVDLARSKPDVRCIATTTTCDVLACVTEDQILEIWDVVHHTQKRVVRLDKEVSSMDFSPDGRLLACGTGNGCVEVIDIGGVRETIVISCFEGESVDSVAFSPDGTLLACGGGERGFTKLIETNQCGIVTALRNWGGWRTTCLAFSPDGKRLATGDALTRVAIWDLVSLRWSVEK